MTYFTQGCLITNILVCVSYIFFIRSVVPFLWAHTLSITYNKQTKVKHHIHINMYNVTLLALFVPTTMYKYTM